MKQIAFLIIMMMASALMAQASDSLSFSLPQNMDLVFDYFSRNYLATESLGRGGTGVASMGGVESILANPASYFMDRSAIYGQLLIKPPVRTHVYEGYNSFVSPVPFGMVAAGGNLTDDLSWGLAYSMPKSIVLDAFRVNMNMGDSQLIRYPIFNQHQLTANFGVHIGELNLGLNVHNQFYYISDFTVLRTFEQIREVKYLLRPQVGALWNTNRINLGLSYTPESKLDWDVKYVKYDTSLPDELSAGISIRDNNRKYMLELDWENSAILHEDYKDRLTLKAGFESKGRKYIYRLGYIYHPEIWHGAYKIPVNETAHPDTAMWWDSVNPGGEVPKNDQHLLTAGLSWPFQHGSLNLGFLSEVSGPSKMTQISASVNLYLDYILRKRNPL